MKGEMGLRLAVLAAVLLVGGTAAAQPSTAELREQLAQARRDRPDAVPEGTLISIGYLIDTANRIEDRFSEQSVAWRRTAAAYLEEVRQGRDPYPAQRGKIVNRAYDSALTTTDQGYAVYVPPEYDPSRPWPLMIVLHGGSSNGNLFLGVVLGNNMSWEHYNQYLWNEFEPRWQPNVIVASPDGFGQVMWRWMGEQDVLDVIEDVQRHYNVDADRVILAGLSNGGVGAYAIGSRHASRFSVVQAIAGAPSWLQYAGGNPLDPEEAAMKMFSGMHLIENTTNTDFRAYHGHTDTGPMRPRFVTQLEEHMRGLDLEPKVTWYDAGHDILYRVHRHGRTFDGLAEVARDPRPRTVRVVSGDYRANRQEWLTLTRMDDYPRLSSARGSVSEGAISITTEDVLAMAVDLRRVPVPEDGEVRIVVDEHEVYRGPRVELGHEVHVARDEPGGPWRLGFPDEPEGTLVKRPGLSGPLTDAYYTRMVHVYGTQDPEHTDALRRAAERGARGWPVWLWRFEQEVVPDTEVTDALMRDATVVLYGTAGDNAVLERMKDELPIRIEEDAVVVGARRHEERGVGVRFIYPNPLAPGRYVMVQGGVTTDAVAAGHNLPDFLPDFLVYDRDGTRSRSRLTTGRNRPVAIGYFDRRWRLRPEHAGGEATAGEGGDPTQGGNSATGAVLPVPTAPPEPPHPRRFGAPADDPAGAIARQIARRVRSFTSFRSQVPGASWTVDPRAVWQIRPQADCWEELRAAGVPFRPQPAHPTPIPSPVEITGPVDGVWFRIIHEDRTLVMSCEMALRLPALVGILKRHGIRGVDVMSAWRERPRSSFHVMGLGLDLARFWNGRRWLSVERDYEATPARETCEGSAPRAAPARTLRAVACELARSRRFSSILTPNYNEGHRDHLHLDARPDDPRVFLR